MNHAIADRPYHPERAVPPPAILRRIRLDAELLERPRAKAPAGAPEVATPPATVAYARD